MSLQYGSHHRRRSSDEVDPLAPPSVYYSKERAQASNRRRRRAFSTNLHQLNLRDVDEHTHRRSSLDERSKPRTFYVNIDATVKSLLETEDTDRNKQITVEDKGPKVFFMGTSSSSGFKRSDLRGTYVLSNLLQELWLAKEGGHDWIEIHEERLSENPIDRLQRKVDSLFWKTLTRRIDGSNITEVGVDPKDWTLDPKPRIYIPRGAPEQYEYYKGIADSQPALRLDVQYLPEGPITPEFVRDLNDKPGLLALAMEEYTDQTTGKKGLRGVPFVVPGGRFNELYGWDSYMVSLGLLESGQVHLAKSIVINFCFCIKHYGKILNANRSYYLLRSQPPFLTDMALQVYDHIKDEPSSLEFLRESMLAAIKEYYTVWMAEPRYDPTSKLSRYRPKGRGVPPETEATHFFHRLQPYAEKYGITFEEFVQKYNHGEIKCPDLDEYFLHDRAVRESGHDTSYRLESVCANLATVDLNSLLYKYELDIAHTIRDMFGDKLPVPAGFSTPENSEMGFESSAIWFRRARRRQVAMEKYMWNEENGMYFDYDTVKQEMTDYESATTFWPMWSGVASRHQADNLVKKALPKFQAYGGLVSGTEESRGAVGLDRPNRQWDYPYGWAPQQMLVWKGLRRYGFEDEAQTLAYKWLHTITTSYVDFNGTVVEKYDVTRRDDPHRVDAEYGNQGLDFEYISKEGFGWVNASFVCGLRIVNTHMRRALSACSSFDTFSRVTGGLHGEES